MPNLLVVELVLIILVTLVLPLCSWYFGRTSPDDADLRGLGLRRGSVRGLLALLVVGSTVNFLLFGAEVATSNFTEIMAALSTLSGSVVGFYFGGRTATTAPANSEPTPLGTASDSSPDSPEAAPGGQTP